MTHAAHIPIPKYQRLADELRLDLATGKLKPGDQLPSFVELRNRHQVSQSTVKQVFELLERDGLIVRERRRGVFVAPKPQRKRTGLIGLVGTGFDEVKNTPYWANVVGGIQEELEKAECQVVFLIKSHAQSMLELVDGAILTGTQSQINEDFPDYLCKIPAVSLLSQMSGVGSVVLDECVGVKQAVEMLILMGHKKIALLLADPQVYQMMEERVHGYRQALLAADIEFQPSWVLTLDLDPQGFSGTDSKAVFMESGRRAGKSWAREQGQTHGCTAVIAQNDSVAVGFIQAVTDAGVRVPEDVSVIGFDGTQTYDFFTPRLTTIQAPLFEVGRKGAELLVKLMKDGPDAGGPKSIVLPTQVRMGASVAPPQRR